MKEHSYEITINWTGNGGSGTAGYRSYERSHDISAPQKPVIAASSDPSFRGDKTKYNPEELLVASISSCHMLWYLHLCAENGVVVTEYRDNATGIMIEAANGSGRFEKVVLRPEVFISPVSDPELANALHDKAHEFCFIANSVNFPVVHEPVCRQEK